MTAGFRTIVRHVTIIQCYAPTSGSPGDEKESFYNRLSGVFNTTPNGDIVIVMGNLNAKVGNDNEGFKYVIGKHGLGNHNENGERFVDFCNANRLVVGGTMFEHKTCHKVSWVSNDRQATTILPSAAALEVVS